MTVEAVLAVLLGLVVLAAACLFREVCRLRAEVSAARLENACLHGLWQRAKGKHRGPGPHRANRGR